jgi:hypothetical protein
MRHYILKGKEPVQVYDLLEWAKWSGHADTTVKRTVLPDGVIISTVFTGTDTNVSNAFPPMVFETIIEGGEHDMYQKRYSTWEEAEKGHEEAIRLVFNVSSK